MALKPLVYRRKGTNVLKAVTATRRQQTTGCLQSHRTRTGRPCNLRKKTWMDSPNLFSHPDTPEYVHRGEASKEPVQNPTFSDQPKRNLT